MLRGMNKDFKAFDRELERLMIEERFLGELRKTGNVSTAILACGDRERVWYYRRRDERPEFARAWDEALLEAQEHLEQVAYVRAVEGWEEPLAHQGVLTGHKVRKFSDQLLVHLLKANVPKFRDQAKVEVNVGDEIIKRLAEGRKRAGQG